MVRGVLELGVVVVGIDHSHVHFDTSGQLGNAAVSRHDNELVVVSGLAVEFFRQVDAQVGLAVLTLFHLWCYIL